jgi:hypothetical protein
MRRFLGSVLLMGAMMAAPLMAQARHAATKAASKDPSRCSVAFTYDPAHANTAGGQGFAMQGAGAQFQVRVWRGLGLMADFAGLHAGNIHSSGVGLDLTTYTFGPRYTWRLGRMSLYMQGLVGGAHGFNGLFPHTGGATTMANSVAALAGGGVDVALAHHVALRLVEADWLRTDLPNSTNSAQNTLRLGFGVVWRFR